MEFRLLGPFEAWHEGRQIDLGDRQQRFVLAVLLLDADKLVSASRLAGLVWPDREPKQTQIAQYVSRLRGAFDAAGATDVALPKERTGYVIRLDDESQVDVLRFRRLCERARVARRVGDYRDAAALLHEAVALWRGDFLSDLDNPLIRDPQASALHPQRLDALCALAELEAADGDHGWVRDNLRGPSHDNPECEPLAAALMESLLAGENRAEAMDVYHRTKEALYEQRGMRPSDRLKELMLRAQHGRTVRYASLPAALPRLAGRDDECRAVEAAIRTAERGDAPALVWIDGMAGVGKTALALHLAHRIADDFPGGHLFEDLRGFGEHTRPLTTDEVLDRFLRKLGLSGRELPDEQDDKAALLRSRLAGTRTLIVLDNAAGPAQVLPLLPGGAGSVVLVTSRVRGGLPQATEVSLDLLPPADAASMFGQLVGHDRVHGESELVASVMRRCARLPLAIRLAATRLLEHPVWPLRRLAEQLDRAQDGEVDPDSGLWNAFHASYRQLTAPQARLFRRMAFLPGLTVDAYGAAVLLDLSVPAAARLLEDLHRVSLAHEESPDRYRLHDPLRPYALRLAGEHGEDEATGDALLDYYLLAAAAAMRAAFPFDADRQPPLPDGEPTRPELAGPADALSWLAAEHHNLVATVGHAAGRGRHEHTWRLAVVLWRYLYSRGYLHQCADLLDSALTASREVRSARGEAQVLLYLSVARWRAGDALSAAALGERSRLRWVEIGDIRGEADALCTLGLAGKRLGRYREATEHYEAALGHYERLGDLRGQANALDNLGDIHERVDDYETALDHHRRAGVLLGRIDDRHGEVFSMDNTGSVLQRLGRFEEAMTCHRDALATAESVGERHGQAYALNNIGNVYRELGETARGLDYHRRALKIAGGLPDLTLDTDLRNDMGLTWLAHGDPAEALRCHRDALGHATTTRDVHAGARAHHGIARAMHAADEHEGAGTHWLLAADLYDRFGASAADEVRATLAALGCACPR